MSDRDWIREIGGRATILAEPHADRILLFAVVREDALSVDLMSRVAPDRACLRFVADEMEDLVMPFWEGSRRQPGHPEWRVLELVISGPELEAQFRHPDELDEENESIVEWRPAAVLRHLGPVKLERRRDEAPMAPASPPPPRRPWWRFW
jgi:hypothetical protein